MYGTQPPSTDTTQQTGSTSAEEIAQRGSEPLERTVSNEPANSLIRTVCLVGAGGSILGSLIMQMRGRKDDALFVGQWAPTLVSIALWYQIVKSQ